MFNVLRPLLFALDPETGHDLAVGMLAAVSRHKSLLTVLERCTPRTTGLPVQVMGLDLPHPVGL
ncbi:MAG: quinone-dependent dihydroorotate dehydrogenase, partial [Gammaproteobacteria bacterium]|nr:quinone-dependent dihydroorotate dehydrogenase [Gammaproteobacteria bacterium]